MLEVGSVFRINHMVLEDFSGRPAGRVSLWSRVGWGTPSVHQPINTRLWEKREIVLRKMLRDSTLVDIRKISTIKEIV